MSIGDFEPALQQGPGVCPGSDTSGTARRVARLKPLIAWRRLRAAGRPPVFCAEKGGERKAQQREKMDKRRANTFQTMRQTVPTNAQKWANHAPKSGLFNGLRRIPPKKNYQGRVLNVIPAKAGIQSLLRRHAPRLLDARVRGHDNAGICKGAQKKISSPVAKATRRDFGASTFAGALVSAHGLARPHGRYFRKTG